MFNALKSIKHGFLEIKKVNGEVLKFGNPDETLKVFLEIKDESLNYNLIKSGSIGLGESYMKDFFINLIPFVHNLNASKCIAIIILNVINGCFK